jgi:hypothetical protein
MRLNPGDTLTLLARPSTPLAFNLTASWNEEL